MNTELSKIIDLINLKEYSKALKAINDNLKLNPNSFAMNKAQGIALLCMERHNSALRAFNKCFEMKSDDYDINVNLAFIFNKVQDYKNSLKFSENALKIRDDMPEVYNNMGLAYLKISELEKAEQYILKSIELRGVFDNLDIFRFKDTLNYYTDVLLAKGDIKSFKTVSQKILDKDVFFGDMFRKVHRNDPDAISEKHIKILYRTIEELEDYKDLINKNLTKSSVYMCLAEYFSNADQRKSEEYYIQSNKIISEIQRGSYYDQQTYIKKIIKFFDEVDYKKLSSNIPNDRGDGLIFIIGMPRSGTTLLESIISTAEDCVAGGEKLFFAMHCDPIIDRFSHDEKDIDDNMFHNLGENYLDIIDIQRKGKKFYIDKLPQNYLYYKFIMSALPKAKFIHIHRDPWDNATSIFKQNFVKEVQYPSSFFGISIQYANYEHLMDMWKKETDHNILDISYDDLVSKTNDCINQIWKFCNLKGEYDENRRKKHFAQTASKQQISKNIYSSSVGKKEFEDKKLEFIENLENQREYWRSAK